jgi:hypothetical protein
MVSKTIGLSSILSGLAKRIPNYYSRLVAYKDKFDPRARESRRKHYYNNKASYILRKTQKKNLIKKYIQEAKNVVCTDCRNKFPYYVMDFDHLSDKIETISRMIDCGNLEKVRSEIAKCEVVCANCHRIRTYNRHTV